MAHKRKKGFIQSAIKHPGELHKLLGIPQGQPIPKRLLQEAAKKPGKEGEEARFALELEGFHHEKK